MTKFSLEVITCNPAKVTQEPASNFGEGAVSTTIEDLPHRMTVVKDGEPQFCIRLYADGKIILTDYSGMGFRKFIEPNMELEPLRPWTPTP
jgi:hypothetical protein